MASFNRFMKYVDRALDSVANVELVDSLRSGFEACPNELAAYIGNYAAITNRQHDVAELQRFFCHWRSPDGAAHAVSSIIIRLLRAANEIDEPVGKDKLRQAAWHCGEIIVEDVGLGEMQGHPHHSKLYYRFATTACESEAWRMQDENNIPAARAFSQWVGDKRPKAADLMEAIEMMIMTELFNTAEYNIMTPMWKNWLVEHKGLSKREANIAASFLSVHCGPVEAKHFFHATSALELYAQATGNALDYVRIRSLSQEYVRRACKHLSTMMSSTLGMENPVEMALAS
jgi:hypothetical protein